MRVVAQDLWSLALDRQQIDPAELAGAIEEQAAQLPLDYRTRLLVRDAIDALAGHWGEDRVAEWLRASPAREMLEDIRRSQLGAVGFPSLKARIMEITRADSVQQFLRELGMHVHRSVHVSIGGSVALILAGQLARRTEDIDLADEIPAEIRSQHALLQDLASRYGLRLAHFQSHFLPAGWELRCRSLGRFGEMEVGVIESYDIFMSKLFSARTKDRDDLRTLAAQLDKQMLVQRLKQTTAALQAEPRLRQHAADNWYIVYGESLPQ